MQRHQFFFVKCWLAMTRTTVVGRTLPEFQVSESKIIEFRPGSLTRPMVIQAPAEANPSHWQPGRPCAWPLVVLASISEIRILVRWRA